MIRFEIVSPVREITAAQYAVQRSTGDIVEIAIEDIADAIDDINKAFVAGNLVDDDIMKAKKNMAELTPITIIDKIGRKKTQWVRMFKKEDGIAGNLSASKSMAHERHKYNMKVQRMGKEASLKHIERIYGKDIADHVRELHETAATVREQKPVRKPATADFVLSDGENVVFITADRKKLHVDPEAAKIVSAYSRSGKVEQADIEKFKRDFIRHMVQNEEVSERSSSRMLHKFLKSGDDSMIIGNGEGDGGYFEYSMMSIMKEMRADSSKDVKEKVKLVGDDSLPIVVGGKAILSHSSGNDMMVKVNGVAEHDDHGNASRYYVTTLDPSELVRGIMIVSAKKLTGAK